MRFNATHSRMGVDAFTPIGEGKNLIDLKGVDGRPFVREALEQLAGEKLDRDCVAVLIANREEVERILHIARKAGLPEKPLQKASN